MNNKFVVVLGDGMADYPIPELKGKTPLQSAFKPNIDSLAQFAEIGIVKTVPDGIAPGSDTANLSVLGYDPKKYSTGRSPLEAVSMGIQLSDTDIAFRCNLVTLSDDLEYENKYMIDYSSDEISSEEASLLIDSINQEFLSDDILFHSGISYRHCMIWKDGPNKFKLTPPHDISDKRITEFLPLGDNSGILLEMMKRSYEILKDHPVNLARISNGLRPANSIWLWGNGTKPAVPKFIDKYGINGAVISAVDLIKGIGICAGLNSIDVEGVTGNIHTNYIGKAEAALNELENGSDFVYIHIEAPDECGHRYEIENKVKSIEFIDKLVVGTIIEGLKKYENYSIMVLPDHPTPLSLRTHTSEPVPYIIYRSYDRKKSIAESYDEFEAQKSNIYIEDGFKLMDRFILG
jgi:2,3-bisphosphoglycerate-independent phosphoglycerate mutase